MASILRSGKILRYFTGLTRNIVVNSLRDADNGSLLQSTPCLYSPFQHGFASNVMPKTDANLEQQLRRLDQDVRRIGRISRRDIEEVLDEIRAQRSATSSQSLLMIRCCGNLVPEEKPEVRTALVQEIWKTLIALNVPMDVSHYNALLRVYLENEHPFSPTEFLNELEAKSIEPNRVTYQRLIARYCQQGDIDGATRILEIMRSKNLPVNENVFNSLILGHSQADDLESAKGIISVMKQAGLEASAETYSTLICCYARHGDIDAILATLKECEEKEIFLLDKDVLDAIYTLTINGHAAKIDVLLSKLRITTGFNQDAVSVILRLVNKGYDDVGLQILRQMPRGTRADGQMTDAGSFFIKQLVKANRPIEKILSVCKILKDEDLNSKSLLVATEAGLNSNINHALPLLRELKNAGLPIRQHYFWPIFCSGDSKQAIRLLRCMMDEFSLNPSTETLRDYVIPNLKEKNCAVLVTILRDAGIPNTTAIVSTAFTALAANDINTAATIMESHSCYFIPQLFKQPLILALAATKDYNSYIRVVRQIYEGIQYRQKSEQNEPAGVESEASADAETSDNDGTYDIVGVIVNETSNYFRRERIEILENILPLLVEQGLSISNANATRISNRIGDQMTPTISEHLGKLSSGELDPIALKKQELRKRGLESLTIDELERFIANVEAKGENANNIKRHLLNALFRSKNLEKTLQTIERLENEKFVISSGIWAQLIDLYTHHSKTTEALALFEKIRVQDKEFLLDNVKTIRIVDLLLKEDRLDDALNFLALNKKPQLQDDNDGSFNYVTSVWRILNTLAESGDVQKLERVFDSLVSNNYVLPNNVILGPLIKVHLAKDDIQRAMETFEQICEKYKSTPWKNELACRLIQKEDAANLQKLTDLSTQIHGEINSLYDLVFSFVECGRVRQARKILETPGLRTRPHRIDNACERYKNEGMVTPLEGLVEATKDLHHIDRNKIYYQLLLSYAKTDDAEKALGLWTKMQEEDVTPTDMFLIKLAQLLEKNGMQVPFVVQQKEKIAKSSPNSDTVHEEVVNVKAFEKNEKVDYKANSVSKFRKAVIAGDIDAAIQLKEQMKPNETSSNADLSRLIELLVREGRLKEATKYVEEILATEHHPAPKIFKFYLNKIGQAGDIETMKRISNLLTPQQKKLISFDNRECSTYIHAGKVEEYLARMKADISAVNSPEEVAILGDKFPRGGAIGILEKHPEKVAEYEEIADKYAKYSQLGPMNVLWMYHISQGNEVASKAIWAKHLSNAPRLMFQRILQSAREQNNDKIVQNVIDQLRQSKISEGAIGNAYSCLIDIHLTNGKADKALDTLKTAVKDVCLDNINRSALLRLKASLVEQNKEFPFEIPEKKSKIDTSSSSSSSSDDDVTPKRPETRPSKPSAGDASNTK